MYSATRLERTIHLNLYSKIRYILEKQCPTSVHLSNTRHPLNQLPLYNPNLAAMHTPRRHRVPRTRRRDPVSTGPELRGIRQSPRRQRTRTAAHSGKSSPGQCTLADWAVAPRLERDMPGDLNVITREGCNLDFSFLNLLFLGKTPVYNTTIWDHSLLPRTSLRCSLPASK